MIFFADSAQSLELVKNSSPVVICGFGELGQTVANMLDSPLAETLERGRVPYVAFDLQPTRLKVRLPVPHYLALLD